MESYPYAIDTAARKDAVFVWARLQSKLSGPAPFRRPKILKACLARIPQNDLRTLACRSDQHSNLKDPRLFLFGSVGSLPEPVRDSPDRFYSKGGGLSVPLDRQQCQRRVFEHFNFN